MNKFIVISTLAAFMLVSVVYGGDAQCTSPGVEVAGNPEHTIIVCDDPGDTTCEQDFETLCPASWHLCDYQEYNAMNDNWAGEVLNSLLGEIQCRPGGGAGHFTVTTGNSGGLYSNDMENNMFYGSSIPGVCESNYGCNELFAQALCCPEEGPYEVCGDGEQGPNEQCDDGNNADGDGCSANCTIESPDNNIPEFTTIGAGLVLLGAGAIVFKKRK